MWYRQAFALISQDSGKPGYCPTRRQAVVTLLINLIGVTLKAASSLFSLLVLLVRFKGVLGSPSKCCCLFLLRGRWFLTLFPPGQVAAIICSRLTECETADGKRRGITRQRHTFAYNIIFTLWRHIPESCIIKRQAASYTSKRHIKKLSQLIHFGVQNLWSSL